MKHLKTHNITFSLVLVSLALWFGNRSLNRYTELCEPQRLYFCMTFQRNVNNLWWRKRTSAVYELRFCAQSVSRQPVGHPQPPGGAFHQPISYCFPSNFATNAFRLVIDQVSLKGGSEFHFLDILNRGPSEYDYCFHVFLNQPFW